MRDWRTQGRIAVAALAIACAAAVAQAAGSEADGRTFVQSTIDQVMAKAKKEM